MANAAALAWANMRLALPWSGRSEGRFAALGPLLMTSVRCPLRSLLPLVLALVPLLAGAQFQQEASAPLRSGFWVLHRSQVNGPGSFEGVAHISFVYFERQRLCQCGSGDFFISPTGGSAVYLGEGGVVTLFRSQSRKARPLTKGFVSSLRRVEWSETTGEAEVVFEQLSPSKPAPRPLRVSLGDGT